MNEFSSGKHDSSRAKASSSNQLLDFYYDQMNDGKQSLSEHNAKSSNPLAKKEQKNTTKQEPGEFSKYKNEIEKMSKKEQSTLKPSQIAGVPPDVGKKASRGFRGAPPLDNNHALATKRQKAILLLETGKKLGLKKEFICISNSEVLSSCDHNPMKHSTATFRRSRRDETASLPSLATGAFSNLKKNLRECRSFPEKRQQSSYTIRQPIAPLRSHLSTVEVDKKMSSQSWPGAQSSPDKHRGIHRTNRVQRCDLYRLPTKSKEFYWENRSKDFSDGLNEINKEKQRLESIKRSSNKAFLPGFFASDAQSKRKSRDRPKRVSISKRTKLPALTQNMFQMCVQNMGKENTCHQHGDLKDFMKENEKYYQRSSSSSPSYTTPDEYDDVADVPMRSCGSNQTKSRRNHKKLGTTNIIQQTLSNRHKHLPPILEKLPNQDPTPVNPSMSQPTSLEKTEPSVETLTNEEQNTISLPPLSTLPQCLDSRKDSLFQDADDEESTTYQNISTDGDIAKSSQHDLSKPLYLDSEFAYRKFANCKRKKKFKLKDRGGISPVDASESSSQMLNKEAERKKHRKKKKLKTASEQDAVSLKQRVFKDKRVSVGSEGDDEMDDDEETNVMLQ